MRLIGDDADLYSAELSEEIEGNGVKTLNEMEKVKDGGKGEYLIAAKAATGSAFGGLNVGSVFVSRDGSTVLKAGDKCKQLNGLKQVAAIIGWSLDLSAGEVEVTTLNDGTKKYRTGKSDATGSIKGQFETDAVKRGEGIQNRFFDVIVRKSDGTSDIIAKKEHPLFIKGYLQAADTQEADKIFIYSEIVTSSMKLGADLGAAQEFDSAFRLAGDVNLQLYYEEKLI